MLHFFKMMTEAVVWTPYELRYRVLLSASPHMACETDPCGTSSAADVADKIPSRFNFRAGLVDGIFPSSALYYCVGDTAVFIMLHTNDASFPPL